MREVYYTAKWLFSSITIVAAVARHFKNMLTFTILNTIRFKNFKLNSMSNVELERFVTENLPYGSAYIEGNEIQYHCHQLTSFIVFFSALLSGATLMESLARKLGKSLKTNLSITVRNKLRYTNLKMYLFSPSSSVWVFRDGNVYDIIAYTETGETFCILATSSTSSIRHCRSTF